MIVEKMLELQLLVHFLKDSDKCTEVHWNMVDRYSELKDEFINQYKLQSCNITDPLKEKQ